MPSEDREEKREWGTLLRAPRRSPDIGITRARARVEHSPENKMSSVVRPSFPFFSCSAMSAASVLRTRKSDGSLSVVILVSELSMVM